LIETANAQDPALVGFGGGVHDLVVRLVESRAGTYVVAHLVVDVRDAMGANAVNTMAEAVAQRAAEIADGRTLLRILTNKADMRLARARAVFDAEALGGPDVVDDIVHASALAESDPYRAATHNKGIMNGLTAVVDVVRVVDEDADAGVGDQVLRPERPIGPRADSPPRS